MPPVVAAAEVLCVETVVNPLQLYHDVGDTDASLDEIKLLLTIRSTVCMYLTNKICTMTYEIVNICSIINNFDKM